MKTWDIVILIINILITIASGIGAYNSIRYFKKSRHITIYAQTNKVLGEIDDMLKRLPEALAAASTYKKDSALKSRCEESEPKWRII